MIWSIIAILVIISLVLAGLGWRVLARRRAGSPPAVPPAENSSRPDPRKRPNLAENGCGLLFGLGWTAFSLIFVIVPLAVLISEWRTAALLNETGVTAEAVVIDHRIDSDSDGDTYYVTYRYDVPLPQGDRSRFTHTESVSRKTYEALPIESRITIRYAANDPEIARITEHSRFFEKVVMLIFFMLFGGVFVLVGLWLLYSSWQGISNARALAQRGLLTTARLTDRWEERDSDGDPQYCVAVRFAVPDGPEVHVAEYNYKAYNQLVEGDPVTVRYLPHNPQICRLEL